MNKNYLLTYQQIGISTFAWFNTEDEMDEFINNNKIHVMERLRINDAEEV